MSKRAKLEVHHAFYPALVCEEIKDLTWTPLRSVPNTCPLSTLLSSKTGFVALRSTGPLKLFVEATEHGDNRLESLFTGSLVSNRMLVIPVSDSVYIDSDEEITYAEVKDLMQIHTEANLPSGSEELRDAFAESCTFHADSFLTSYLDLLEILESSSSALQGPPDFCRMGFVDPSGLIEMFSPESLFFNNSFVKKLESLTGLNLALPRHPARIWKLEKGSYRMLNEERGDRLSEGLDLLFCLTMNESGCEEGVVQYVDKESGEVVASCEPVANRLWIAYRTEGANRFIRYIPKTSSLDQPIYYIALTYPALE